MSFIDQCIYPMEPRLSRKLPLGETYRYQVKWDGMRLLAFGCRGRLRLQGKSLRDKTAKYPELAPLTQQVEAEEFILDGELIALHEGRPSFYSLMGREHRGAAGRDAIPVFYMVFDCLYYNGKWLGDELWKNRQEILCNVLQESEEIRICNSYTDGESLLIGVKKEKLEGVVAKQINSPYVNGPCKSPHWLKFKLEQQIEARVGGILLKNNRAVSLLLGLEEEGLGLRYIGNVSSGFTDKELAQWLQWGLEHKLSQPPFQYPFAVAGNKALWIEPLRCVSVVFNEWTPGSKLRAPRVMK